MPAGPRIRVIPPRDIKRHLSHLGRVAVQRGRTLGQAATRNRRPARVAKQQSRPTLLVKLKKAKLTPRHVIEVGRDEAIKFGLRLMASGAAGYAGAAYSSARRKKRASARRKPTRVAGR